MRIFSSRILWRLGVAAVLSLSAAAHGATPGFPFVENFQSQTFFNASSSTAQWSERGITLAPARGAHKESYSFKDNLPNLEAAIIHDIALQDADGDGVLDMVIATTGGISISYTTVLTSDNIHFSTTRIGTGLHRALAFGDLDGDGDLDIVALKMGEQDFTAWLYKGNGRGGFEEGFPVPGSEINDLATADMNGDGHLDLVLASRGGAAILRNDGEGSFDRLLLGRISAPDAGKVVASGDFDGDGLPDVVLGGAMLKVFRNTKDRGFVEMASHAGAVSSVALGDVDNDGDLDIVAGANGARNVLYLNDGSGGFDAGAEINGNFSTKDVRLGDMDGDGDLDLVEANDDKNARIYWNGGGRYKDTGSSLPFSAAHAVALGDLDNDGDLDLVVGDDTLRMKVCLNRGISVTATSATLYDTGRGWVSSSKVNVGSVVPQIIHLTATETKPANTDVAYYLSNDGGGRWHQVRPGGSFEFPQSGNDLRWAARLTSLSPTTSPVIKRIDLEGGLQVYINNVSRKSGATYKANNDQPVAVGSSLMARLKLWNRGKDELAVGFTLEPANQGFVLPEIGPAGTTHTIAANTEYEPISKSKIC